MMNQKELHEQLALSGGILTKTITCDEQAFSLIKPVKGNTYTLEDTDFTVIETSYYKDAGFGVVRFKAIQ